MTDVTISLNFSPAAKRDLDEIMALGEFEDMAEAFRYALGCGLATLRYRRVGYRVFVQKGSEQVEFVWNDAID